jgi:ubiquinone/menaquinone biosynthesis C-methylase UbiE
MIGAYESHGRAIPSTIDMGDGLSHTNRLCQDRGKMTNHPHQEPDTGPTRADHYVAGYSPATIQHYTRRTVARQAAFILPHLRAGMTLLDCGCGPGTITLGLAQTVAPGLVVGIDIEPSVVARARVLGREQGVSTVHFHVASSFALPFAEGSFDAVFAHTLLQHLSRPISTLKEMGRVLQSGGVIGIRTVDHGGRMIVPANPGLEEYYDLHERIWQHHGSDLRLGRHLRSLLRQAGFIRIAGSASYDYAGTLAETRALALAQIARIKSTPAFDEAVEAGWVDRPGLETMMAAWQEWGEHPDAFHAMAMCEVVGWKA